MLDWQPHSFFCYRRRDSSPGIVGGTTVKKLLMTGLVLTAFAVASPAAHATWIEPTLQYGGLIADTSVIWYVDLAGLGLTHVGVVTLIDDNDGIGGAPGIFSGADIDALFLDTNGGAVGGQILADEYEFTPGSVRPTGEPWKVPGPGGSWFLGTYEARPGILHGLDAANVIDPSITTFGTFDSMSAADRRVSDGFLSMGDGGVLKALFDPLIPIGDHLYLFIAEAGNNRIQVF